MCDVPMWSIMTVGKPIGKIKHPRTQWSSELIKCERSTDPNATKVQHDVVWWLARHHCPDGRIGFLTRRTKHAWQSKGGNLDEDQLQMAWWLDNNWFCKANYQVPGGIMPREECGWKHIIGKKPPVGGRKSEEPVENIMATHGMAVTF